MTPRTPQLTLLVTAVAATAFVAAPSDPVQAADISWTVGEATDDSVVADIGTTVEAVFFTGSTAGNALDGTQQLLDPVTVNGVEFSPIDCSFGEAPTVLVDLPYFYGEYGHTAATTGVEALVAGLGAEAGINPQFPSLTGLTPGNTYVVQFFYYHRTANRTLTIRGDELDGALLEDAGPAVVATGTFRADATSQALTLEANTGSQFVNAYQLRDRGIVSDTDGDGMPDDFEIANMPPLDPNVPDADADPDADGSPNLEEYQRGTGVNDPDSDDDGLLDGAESGSGIFGGPDDPGTDPLDPDADRDGLLDGAEVGSANGSVTDPFLKDTDLDGFSDPLEVAEGTDPTNPNDGPAFGSLLAAYWPLDVRVGEAGSETTPDVVNGLDLMLVDEILPGSLQLVEGARGMAFSFDNAGQTMLVRVNDPGEALPVSQHSSYTVSLWIKADGLGQNDLRFFSEGSTTNARPLVNIGTHNAGADGTVDIYLRDDANATGGHEHSLAAPFDGLDWHHVALVVHVSAQTADLYIDGVRDDAFIDFIDVYSPVMNTTTVGGILRANPSHWVTGSIDEVSLWKTALDDDQIASLAAGTTPLELIGGGAPFAFTDITVASNGDVTLTWNSTSGATYALDVSNDLVAWSEYNDSIPSGGSSTTVTVPGDLIATLPETDTVFFRAREP